MRLTGLRSSWSSNIYDDKPKDGQQLQQLTPEPNARGLGDNRVMLWCRSTSPRCDAMANTCSVDSLTLVVYLISPSSSTTVGSGTAVDPLYVWVTAHYSKGSG